LLENTGENAELKREKQSRHTRFCVTLGFPDYEQREIGTSYHNNITEKGEEKRTKKTQNRVVPQLRA